MQRDGELRALGTHVLVCVCKDIWHALHDALHLELLRAERVDKRRERRDVGRDDFGLLGREQRT